MKGKDVTIKDELVQEKRRKNLGRLLRPRHIAFVGGSQAMGGLEACQLAIEKGVPIIVLRGGDTPAGEVVAASHTGAMVVERDIWDAFAVRYRLVEVSSPKAMVETLKLLAVCGVPAGRRLSVATFSGGLNSLIAARAPRLGLELVPPTAENGRKLRQRMPPHVPITNPLDLNFPWRSRTGHGSLTARSPKLFTEDLI